MIKTYTRNELNTLNEKFNKLNSVSGSKIVYAASKSHAHVKRELKVVQDLINKARSVRIPGEEEYRKEWQEAYKAAAKKDEKGNPIVVGEGQSAHYDIEDAVAFNEAAKAIDEKHKPVVDAGNEKNVEIQEFMGESVTIEFHEIDDKALDDEGSYTATKEQIDIIRELLVKEEI